MKRIVLILFAFCLSQITYSQTNTFPTTGNVGIGTTTPNTKLHIFGINPVFTLQSEVDQITKINFVDDNADRAFIEVDNSAGVTNFWTTGYTDMPLTLGTNNTERLRINNDGNIGIGTTTPTAKLDVNGDINISSGHTFKIGGVPLTGISQWLTNGSNIFYNSGNVGIGVSIPQHTLELSGEAFFSVGEDFDAFTIQNGPSGQNAFRYDGDQNLLFLQENGGNVGIGTITPTAKLDVNGDINITSGHTFKIAGVPLTGVSQWLNGSNSIFYNSGNVGIGTTTPNPNYKLDVNGSIGGTTGNFNVLNSGYIENGGNIMFTNQSNYSIYTESGEDLFINPSGGNVGIGTTTPTAKLDVNGDINISTGHTFKIGGVPLTGVSQWLSGSNSIFYNSGNVGIGTTTPNPNYKLDVNGSIGGTTGNFNSLYSGFIESGGNIMFTNQSNYSIYTESGEDLFINPSGGNVGIGTMNPTAKLEVNGDINITSGHNFKINGSNIAPGEPILGNPSTNGYVLSSTTTGVRSWIPNGSGSMIYPGVGIPVSTGSTWAASIPNNSDNWNYAYSYSQIGHLPLVGGDMTGGITFHENVNDYQWTIYNSSDDGDFIFDNNGQTRVTFQNGGNVGIGTTATPNNKLEINHGTAGNSGLRFTQLTSASATTTSNGKFLSVNATGDVVLVDGGSSSSTWSLTGNSGTNPTNNCIGTTDAQDLAIKTNNIERFRVKSNGNIGIGLANPLNKLQLDAGNATACYNQFTVGTTTGQTATDGTLFGTDATGNTIIKQQENLPILFYTNNVERFRVSGTGNVGVGITNPLNKLQLDAGNATACYNQFTVGTTTGQTATDGTLFGTDATGNTIIKQQENLPVLFYTNNLERFRVSSTGNVGVGITNPLNKLHIDAGNATACYNQFTVGTTTGQAATDGTLFGTDASGNAIINQQEGLPLIIYTSKTERIRVLNNGYIGIGTSIPQSPLQVQPPFATTNLVSFLNSDFIPGVSGSGMKIFTGNATGNTYTGIQTYTMGQSAYGDLILNPNMGNVGIGTTTPTRKLEVNGTIRIYNASNSNAELEISGSQTGAINYSLRNTVSTMANPGFEIYDITNSTSRLAIRNGNVGIGTITPNNKFEINHGTAGNSGLRFTQLNSSSTTTIGNGKYLSVNSTGDVVLVDGNSSTPTWNLTGNSGTNPTTNFIGTTDAKDFRIRTNNIDRLTLSSNGDVILSSNVYMRKTNPTITLEGNPANIEAINFKEDGTLMGQIALDDGYFKLKSWNSPIIFAPNNIESFRISLTGNVGIGATLPYAKLEVVGKSGITSFTGNSLLGLVVRSSNDQQFDYSGIDFSGYNPVSNPNSLNPLARIGVQKTSYGTSMSFGTSNCYDCGITNTAMTINSIGNVGIGTTNPTTKLAVNGSIKTKEVIITLDGWSDFVFHSSYKLRTLGEVEKFIKTNNHLPEIPSETEVKENGISVGEMNAKLLQKIEELTLYVIDLQKQVNELKSKK